MKIAVHILGYNVSRFASAVIRNVAPHVDRIYVAYAEKPFAYIPESRLKHRNPTRPEEFTAADVGDKIRLIFGDWLDEESMRNACLTEARREGFDWLLIQDADEFYSKASWRQIRDILGRSQNVEHFITTWYNFWQTSQYVLVHPSGEIKHTNAGFAVRCASKVKFVNRRMTDAATSKVIDASCFHYGYVMSDEEMHEKLFTWSHAHQVDRASWYRDKWLGWRDESRFLHPVHPWIWQRAIRFPLEQPDFADEFALTFAGRPRLSRKERLLEEIKDMKILLRSNAANLKRRLF